ncbi:MAG: TlpA family protein disulfide reductase [Bdellovibrionales bacterium]|nr:TlpA family protein disulfide reductase [Bdellovibrionales bacterium]
MDTNENSPHNDLLETRKVLKTMMIAAFALIILLSAGLWFMSRYLQNPKPQTMTTYSNKKTNVQLSPNIPQYIWPEDRLTLLNFWASWCAPCKKELPQLNQLAQDLPNLNVVLLNVDNKNENSEIAIQEILSKISPLFAKNLSVDPQLMSDFEVEVLPSSFLVNSHKEIVWKSSGEIDWLSAESLLRLSKFIKYDKKKAQKPAEN